MEIPDTREGLEELIRRTIDEIGGPEAEARVADWWTSVWEVIVCSAFDLGLPQMVEGLNEPLPPFVYSPQSPAAKAIRDIIRDRLVKVRRRLQGNPGTGYSDLTSDDYRPAPDWHESPEARAILAERYSHSLAKLAAEFDAGNFAKGFAKATYARRLAK